MNKREYSRGIGNGICWKELSGRKGEDIPVTLNPDICAQPACTEPPGHQSRRQTENSCQTESPAQHGKLLINKPCLSEAAPGACQA